MNAALTKDGHLLTDQVRALFDHTVLGSAATLINGFILFLVLRHQAPALNLWLWLGAAAGVSVLRLTLYWRFRKAEPSSRKAILLWKKLFSSSLFAAGLLWGAAALVLFPPHSVGHQTFIAFVIGGMVAGAVGAFTAMLSTFFYFSIPALLPIAVRFYLLGSEIHVAMGTMVLLFLLIMSLAAVRTHRDYVKLLSLRYEKRALVEDLQQEIAQRRAAEEDLRRKNQQIEEIVAKRTQELKTAVAQLSEEVEIRQKAVQALREEEEKYRELVENLNDVLFATDDRGHVTFISPVVETVFGYRPEEILGRQFFEFVDAGDKTRMTADFETALGMKARVGEYRFVSRSGQIRWCRTSTRPILENERVVGVQGILADITRSKQLEAQLQRAQKMEALGTLAGGVAHDLNNILSGLVSYPELLLIDLPEDSPLRGPLATIKASGDKASAIVEDLLTLARRGVAAMELVNLNRVIEEYLVSPEFRALQRVFPEMRIKKELQSDLFNLVGSRVHITKTLMNLVSNAAEAMPAGGQITIRTANHYADRPHAGFETVAEGEYVVLMVADTGVGICEEDLPRIFEPFYTKKIMGRSGSGLGMAVVWGTVKDHGGYINVNSSQDAGTCFDLLFPATRQAMPQSSRSVPLETYMGRGESILVIDDIHQQREITARMLTRLGYRPETAPSGEAALDYLACNHADLVLLDMIMSPGIDGLETYRRILDIKPGQKAIIVSGYSETDQVRDTLALGAIRYIKKPYSIETIGTAIRDALDRPPGES